MKVFIACEESGVMRRAFAARGHFAVSCDLLPARDGRDASASWLAGVRMGAAKPGNKHVQMDVFKALAMFHAAGVHFDLMIHHAPCTFSTLAGARWLYGGKGTRRDAKRWASMVAGAEFFRRLQDYPHIARVAGENPVPHRYARKILGGYSQLVQPWQFGDFESKKTGFWLRGLPLLAPTYRTLPECREALFLPPTAKPEQRVWKLGPSADRAMLRSETFPGIANACAEQWGAL